MKMNRFFVIVFALALTAFLFWQANSPVRAEASPPTCGGRDLLAELKGGDPAAYKKIMDDSRRTPNGEGLLWKIEKPGVPASYLFGTIHVTDSRVTTLPAAVSKALSGSRTIALELEEVVNKSKMAAETIKNIKLIAFLDGRSIETMLAPGEIVKLKAAMKSLGMPYAPMRIMKPWFFALTMALPSCEMQRAKAGLKPVDEVIGRAGQKAGAKIIGLETVAEQFGAFDSLTLKEQKLFLLSSLAMLDKLDDQMETMKNLYLNRRPGAIWAFTRYFTKKYASADDLKAELAVIERFRDLLVVKRNLVMRKRALPLLDKGAAFIAVGALHLPGETGLVALLRNKGYKITKVY